MKTNIMHHRDHPICIFIRDFHLQFEAVVRASCDVKLIESFGINVIIGYIYPLFKMVLFVVSEDQIIKQKKNILNVKKYKEVLRQWFDDWFTDGIHEQLPEVLCF